MIDQAKNVLLGSKTNYLIVKDDVGKAKPTTRDLPSLDFAYGKTDLSKNKEGAAQVCTSWLSNPQTTKNEKFNPRNFAKLNKWAVLDG